MNSPQISGYWRFKGYDIILRADWIYTHSPVGLDLRRREFCITKNGKLVTCSDETLQYNHQVIGAKKLYQLLKKKAIGAVVLLNNSPSHSATSFSANQNYYVLTTCPSFTQLHPTIHS
jgi:hypothetical protein